MASNHQPLHSQGGKPPRQGGNGVSTWMLSSVSDQSSLNSTVWSATYPPLIKSTPSKYGFSTRASASSITMHHPPPAISVDGGTAGRQPSSISSARVVAIHSLLAWFLPGKLPRPTDPRSLSSFLAPPKIRSGT